MAWDDDEDWVGEPPEGRHPRYKAKPEYWQSQRPVSIAAFGIGFVLLVLLVAWLL